MVIIGYQGIGKSSVTARSKQAGSNKYIDLESSNFFVDGKRPDSWHHIYAQIAEDLSSQGFTVFVSSHDVVRKALAKLDVKVVIITPGLHLKDQWIERLQKRYESDPSDKNFKALENAKAMYEQGVSGLLQQNDFDVIEIKNIDYDLTDIIDYHYT